MRRVTVLGEAATGRWVRGLGRAGWSGVVAGLLVLGAPAAPASAPAVTAELVAEVETVHPGSPVWVAVRLIMAEGWHTYWVNPGDGGLATSVRWTVPPGVSAGPLQWPYPERFIGAGMASFGYTGEAWLLAEVSTPPSLRHGERVALAAHVEWLECADVCRVGEADLALELPVSRDPARVSARWGRGFAEARGRLPGAPQGWALEAAVDDRTVRLHVIPPERLAATLTGLTFFPERAGLIVHGDPQAVQLAPQGVVLELTRYAPLVELPARLRGVLVARARKGPRPVEVLAVDLPLGAQAAGDGL